MKREKENQIFITFYQLHFLYKRFLLENSTLETDIFVTLQAKKLEVAKPLQLLLFTAVIQHILELLSLI